MGFRSGESPISRALRNAGQIIGGYLQSERQRRLQEELRRGQLSQERAKLLVDGLREELAKQYALPPGQQDRRTIANLEREIQQLGGVLDAPAREAAPVFRSATAGFDQTTRGRRTTADREAPVRRQDVEAGTGRVAEARDVTLPGLQGRTREQPTQAVIGQAAGESARAQRVFESEQAQAEALQSQVTRIQNEVIPDQIERLDESITDNLTQRERREIQAQIETLENMQMEQPSGVQGAQDFINRAQRMPSPTALASEARATGAGRAETGEAQVENARAILDTATSYQDTILDLSGEVEDDELAGELRRRANAIGQLPRTVAAPEGATEFMNQWNALEGERPTAALLVEAQQQAAQDATASERDQGTLDIMQDFATREGLTSEEKLNQIAAAASAMPEGFLERNRERVAQIEGLANLEDPQALRQRTLEQRQQQLQNRLSELDVKEAERTLDEVVEQERLQTIRDRIDTEIASGTRDAEIQRIVSEAISAGAEAQVDDATIDALITSRRLDAVESQLDVDFKEATFDDRVTRVGQEVAEGKISIEDGLAELYRNEVRFKQNTQLKDAEITRANQAIRDANIELERGQEDEFRNRVISAAETGFTGDLNDDEMAALAHYLGHEPGSQEFTAEISEIRQSNLDAIEASREREELLNDELIESIGLTEDRARREAEEFEWERYEHNQTLSENAVENVTDFETELMNAVQGGNPGLFNNLLTALENPEAYPQLNRALKERGFGGRRGRNRLKTLRDRARETQTRAQRESDLQLDRLEAQVRSSIGSARAQQFQTAESIAATFDSVESFEQALPSLPRALRNAVEEEGLGTLVRNKITFRNAVTEKDESLERLSSLRENRPNMMNADARSAWRTSFVSRAEDAGFTGDEAQSMADAQLSAWGRDADEYTRALNEHDLDMQLARKRLDKLGLDIEDLRNPDSKDAADIRASVSAGRQLIGELRRTIEAEKATNLCYTPSSYNQLLARRSQLGQEGMTQEEYAQAYQQGQSPSQQQRCGTLEGHMERATSELIRLGEMVGVNVGVDGEPDAAAEQGASGQAEADPVIIPSERSGGGRNRNGGQNQNGRQAQDTGSLPSPPGGVAQWPTPNSELSDDANHALTQLRRVRSPDDGLYLSTEEQVDFINVLVSELGEREARRLVFPEDQ